MITFYIAYVFEVFHLLLRGKVLFFICLSACFSVGLYVVSGWLVGLVVGVIYCRKLFTEGQLACTSKIVL